VKTIEITIDPKGQTTIATKGFTGQDCREASRLLEIALGQRTAETLTGEFFQDESTRHVAEQST